MKTGIKSFILLISTIASIALAKQDKVYSIGTYYYPPYSMYDENEVIGVSTDIVNKIMKTADLDYLYREIPVLRGLNMVYDGDFLGLYPVTKTAKIKQDYVFIGPILTNKWAAFTLANRNLDIHSIEDLAKYNCGSVRGSSFLESIEEKYNLNIDKRTKEIHNFNKLLLQRIDVWITGDMVAPYISFVESDVKMKKVLDIGETDLYLVLSKTANKEVIDKVSKSFDSLKADGTIDSIIQEYRARLEVFIDFINE